MELDPSQLLLKRTITVKAVVTDRWKEEAQAQLQKQIDRLDGQLQQLEVQGHRTVRDIQQQHSGIAVTELPPQVRQQIDNVQIQVNQQKSQLLEQKNQILQQLQQVQTVQLGNEVNQGQIDSVFPIGIGDNLVKKLQVEVLLEDGIVREIRGEL
ncbi:MAG: YlqD family protein [Geitlerinemataceae cyanobacterium]